MRTGPNRDKFREVLISSVWRQPIGELGGWRQSVLVTGVGESGLGSCANR